MHYVRPQVTGSFLAISAIQSTKGLGEQEIGSNVFTNGAAYRSDE